MRRGFVFTLDAILSLVLVSLVLVSVVAVTENSSSIYATQLRAENKQLAEGILQTLRTVPLDQLVSPSLINTWISNGTLNLTYVDPKMPPLQIAATYWALSVKHPEFKGYASLILGEILRDLAGGYKYQLIINNYTDPFLTFDNSYENASDVGTATMMVSGYLFNQSPRGYVAKAYLTKVLTEQRKLVGIQRVLAGGGYCTNPRPGGHDYNFYTLSVNSLSIQYQTPSGKPTQVSSGRFRVMGRYSGGTVDLNVDLGGWSVSYKGGVTLSKDGYSLKLYLSYLSSVGNTRKYKVTKILFEYPSGDQLGIVLNSGVYVEITRKWKRSWLGGHWVISSSKAYTRTARIIRGVYAEIIPGYSCRDEDYYNNNNIDIKFDIDLPSDTRPRYGVLSVYTRQDGNVFDVIKFNNKTWKNSEGNLTIPLSSIWPETNTVYLKVSRYDDSREVGLGSGSWVDLGYVTSTPHADDPGLIKLYDVTSKGTGIYYLNSIFVPGNVTGIEMNLTFSGVHEVRVYYSNGTVLNLIYENTSIIGNNLYISNSTIMRGLLRYTTLESLSRKNFNLVIMLDAEYGLDSVLYAGQDYHREWNNKRILYGYPYSWIRISYNPTVTGSRFYIPIEETHDLESLDDTEMHFSYYLPGKAIPWYVDVWTGIIYTPGLIDTSNNITLSEGPDQTEFLSFPLDVYLIRVAYTKISKDIMVNGSINKFKIESTDDYYTFRPAVSRAIVHYFLNGYAPYGKVFTYYAQDNACGYNLTYWYDLTGNGDGTRDSVIVGNCKPSDTPSKNLLRIWIPQNMPWTMQLCASSCSWGRTRGCGRSISGTVDTFRVEVRTP